MTKRQVIQRAALRCLRAPGVPLCPAGECPTVLAAVREGREVWLCTTHDIEVPGERRRTVRPQRSASADQ